MQTCRGNSVARATASKSSSRAIVIMRWSLLLLVASSCAIPMVMGFNNSNKPNSSNNKSNKTIQPQIGNMKLSASITSEEVRARLLEELGKLRQKDRQSKAIDAKVRTVSLVFSVFYHLFWCCSASSAHFTSKTPYQSLNLCRSFHLNSPLYFVYPFHHHPLLQDLKVVYEDRDIVIVDKPSGVLCVPTEEGIPSLAQVVFEKVNHSLSSYDRMVVHRLGMDTSGLVVFAKTMDALRGMNALFRTRKIQREYEVLVCGHLKHSKEGIIDMPLMRDYEYPPYMRVSTEYHQHSLLHLDSSIVGKKLLEAPKPSQTKYKVISLEELKVNSDDDTKLPVSRLLLNSITGRTHQLNVHCAAFGHAIVADRVYGVNGDAAPNGGLVLDDYDDDTSSGTESRCEKTDSDDDSTTTTDPSMSIDTTQEEETDDSSPALIRSIDAASDELQERIAKAAAEMPMCVHAKRLEFQHPVTNKLISVSSPATF